MKRVRGERIWDSEKELDFIVLWQQHSCLFNLSSGSYHDRKRRDAAWEEIAVSLQLPVDEVTTRASTLRTQYGKLLRPKSGDEDSQPLTPRQKWIKKHLIFLKPHIKRISTSRQVTESPIMAFFEEPFSVNAASFPSPSPVHEPPKPLSRKPSNPYNTGRSKLAPVARKPKAPKKKELEFEQEQMKLFKMAASNNSNGKGEDEDDIFGKQVACEMRHIRDPMDKLLARRAITKVLYDAQDRSMTQSVTVSQSASHQMYDFLTVEGEPGEVDF